MYTGTRTFTRDLSYKSFEVARQAERNWVISPDTLKSLYWNGIPEFFEAYYRGQQCAVARCPLIGCIVVNQGTQDAEHLLYHELEAVCDPELADYFALPCKPSEEDAEQEQRDHPPIYASGSNGTGDDAF